MIAAAPIECPLPSPLTSETETIRAVFQALRAGGVTLWREGDALRAHPTDAVTEPIRALIAAHRPLLLHWLAHEPRDPIAVRLAALDGETIWLAADTALIPEVYAGRIVYRMSELRLIRHLSPDGLRRLHSDKALLYSFWHGHGWYTYAQLTAQRRAAGIPDSERRRISRIMEHLGEACTLQRAAPDGRLFLTECHRIVPPDERWPPVRECHTSGLPVTP